MPERLTFPDSVALAAPEAAGRSVSSLVAYLKQHLSTDDQLARAIYTWVSRNIKYNVYITYTSRNEEADETKYKKYYPNATVFARIMRYFLKHW